MLWFPAPPTVPRVVDRPQHSLAYLAFLARKGPSTPASSDGALDERILQAVRSALRPAVDPDELGRQIAGEPAVSQRGSARISALTRRPAQTHWEEGE